MKVPLVIEYVIATLGALALQGGPIAWVSMHRAHHRFSDTPRDPHDSNRGFWWSHVLWLFAPNASRLEKPDQLKYARELAANPYYRFLESGALILTIALAFGLYAFGGWPCVIWGIFVRLVVTYHVTWLVNSATHQFGYRTYDAGDRSTNNWLVGLLAWGEGWHNNHHAFPASARHGLRWYEIDLTWAMIRLLAALRIATRIRIPSPEMLARGPVVIREPARMVHSG
jgi:stearoyl-CoA desaturase (delta-9 desaturase)